MKRWNKERFCLTIHGRSCLNPEQLRIPIAALLQLAEKLVGSVLCFLFTCWFVGLFGVCSMCVSIYVPSAHCMKKSLGKQNKTTGFVLL